MKRFCFLVQCDSHCGELSGKLAILITDYIRVGRTEQTDASKFTPGTSVNWTPLTRGSCIAMILADLRLAGYSESIQQEHMEKLHNMPTQWTTPLQVIEVECISVQQ